MRIAASTWSSLLLAVSAAVLAGCPAPHESPPPRHLVLITLDTLRADHVGAYGYPRPTTPNLDALARRGVRFDEAIAQAITTPPSHASILTGLTPPQHGLRRLSGQSLAPGNLTLAEALRDHGFHTAAFVSAAPLRRGQGLHQGFDVYDDDLDGSPERSGAETTARVRDWLATAPEARTFLWVHFFEPHMPYFAPAEHRTRFHPRELRREDVARQVAAKGRGRPRQAPLPDVVARMTDLYDAEIASMDQQVGELLALLEAHGMLADAVVAAVADHGECLGEGGFYFGHWDIWRATARVPMVLTMPDGRWANTVVSATVRSVDLMPTVLRWLGVEPPPGLEGRDLTPLIEGTEEEPRTAYTEHVEYFPARAVREGKWILAEHDWGEPSPEFPHHLGLYERASDDRELLAANAPGPIRERLEAALHEAASPATTECPVAVDVSDEVRFQLEALGYVVEPTPTPAKATPAPMH